MDKVLLQVKKENPKTKWTDIATIFKDTVNENKKLHVINFKNVNLSLDTVRLRYTYLESIKNEIDLEDEENIEHFYKDLFGYNGKD